jgi:hypothetical protein
VHKEINLAAERIFNALTHVSIGVGIRGVDDGPIYTYLASIREYDSIPTAEEKPLILDIIRGELVRLAERLYRHNQGEMCNCDGDGLHPAHD